MKTTLFLLALILINFSSFSQDFGAPRRYNVNVEYSSSFSDMYASMLMERRRAYDQNSKDIQNKVNDIYKLINRLFEPGTEDYNFIVGKVNNYIQELNTAQLDYGDVNQYNSVLRSLQIYEDGAWLIYKKKTSSTPSRL